MPFPYRDDASSEHKIEISLEEYRKRDKVGRICKNVNGINRDTRSLISRREGGGIH